MARMSLASSPTVARWLRDFLPEERRAPAVVLNPLLILYVVTLAAVSVVATAVTYRPVSDPATLVLGSLVLFGAAYCSVRITEGVDGSWTAGLYIHLALALTFGPLGALSGALAQAAASGARLHGGWFRFTFNVCNIYLSNLCAWLVFSLGLHLNLGFVGTAAGATLAGALQCLVNSWLLAEVVRLASGGAQRTGPQFVKSLRHAMPYNIGYGWAAYGAVLLHQVGGIVGFSTTLLPIVLLQGFLLVLARRIRAQDLERAEHAKIREALLQQAIDAGDAERTRIASDLHDGVVQTLAGLAFSLAARGSGKTEDPQLLEAADTLRSSVTDLRTLMIEIAPPNLDGSGVDSAVRKLLEPLPSRGIEVEFDVDGATHLPADKTSLVFRVAQEAVRNIVNHSQATKVITTLTHTDGMLTLEMADNGKGFSSADRSRRREEGHVGLHLLNNAVEAASGHLTLTSEPGHGTSLMLQLPC
jgi:signal transduction histidine kinase